jgi:hypothetical protein
VRGIGDECEIDCGDPALFCDYSGAAPTCQARAGDGEDCSLSACFYGFNCVGNLCEPGAPEGGECDTSACGPGLYCDYGDYTCTPLHVAGDACTESRECASAGCDQARLICVDDTRSAEGASCATTTCDGGLTCALETAGAVCRPRVTGREPGDPCTPDGGYSGTCGYGLYCTGDSECADVPIVDDGACRDDAYAGGPLCSGSFSTRFCDDGTCADRADVDEDCFAAECVYGSRCIYTDEATATCLADAAAGAPCGEPTDPFCGAGLVCEDTCKPPLEVTGVFETDCTPP